MVNNRRGNDYIFLPEAYFEPWHSRVITSGEYLESILASPARTGIRNEGPRPLLAQGNLSILFDVYYFKCQCRVQVYRGNFFFGKHY